MKNLLLASMVGVALLSGCATNLSTNKSFSSFQQPPEGKATVYFVRDDNFMADKPRYLYITTALADNSDTPKSKYINTAIVGRNMFVPILALPGDYYFRNTLYSSDKVSIKAGEVLCFDVGSKFRGITIFAMDKMDLKECEELMKDKTEGVQLREAGKRLGWEKLQSLSDGDAQKQVTIQPQQPILKF